MLNAEIHETKIEHTHARTRTHYYVDFGKKPTFSNEFDQTSEESSRMCPTGVSDNLNSFQG